MTTNRDFLPVLALIGRPNVGKSTLFNRLTRTRDALVADIPGLTRDRQYGYGKTGEKPFIVVDTGGLIEQAEGVDKLTYQQSLIALREADHVLFLVDGRAGITPTDEAVSQLLRRENKPVTLVLNKAEGLKFNATYAEFAHLGWENIEMISAAHGDGVYSLVQEVLAPFPEPTPEPAFEPEFSPEEIEANLENIIENNIESKVYEDDFRQRQQNIDDNAPLRIAVIGRPNVGKSTLVNRLVGEERVLACDLPGTTRDAIEVPFERDGREWILIDTAGVRRKGRVEDVIEKFSIVKTLQAIDRADVVINVLDAQSDISAQDAKLMGLAAERGRASIIAINKWDGLSDSERKRIKDLVDYKLPFLDYAPLHFISAKEGSGLGDMFKSLRRAAYAARRVVGTGELNRVMMAAVEKHQPPQVSKRRVRLKYAHQGGINPPTFVIHGNQTEQLPDAYRRYLMSAFRDKFKLYGTPVKLVFRNSHNPYVDGEKPRKLI